METGRFDKANPMAISLALFYEFCGSALMSYTFNLSEQWDFARAFAYMFAYVAAYHISGAHFNPATTLAVYMTEKKYE